MLSEKEISDIRENNAKMWKRWKHSIPSDLKPKYNFEEIIKYHEIYKQKSFKIEMKFTQDLLFFDKYIAQLKAEGVVFNVKIILHSCYWASEREPIQKYFSNYKVSLEELRKFMKDCGYVYLTEIAGIEKIIFEIFLE